MTVFGELFLVLLLAHLIADFPLQNNWLINLKRKSWQGIVLHSLIVVVITGMLTFPWLKELWPALLVIGLGHFIVDAWKIRVEQARWLKPGSQTGYFLADQLFHGLVLLLVSWGAFSYLSFRGLDLSRYWLSLAPAEVISLIIITWIIFGQAILNQYIINMMLGEARSPFFTNLERYGGMALRGVLGVITFYYLWVGVGLIALVMLVLVLFKPSKTEPYKVQRLGSLGGFARGIYNDLYGGQRQLLGVALNVLSGSVGGVLLHSVFSYF
jgi:hypothetical protein